MSFGSTSGANNLHGLGDRRAVNHQRRQPQPYFPQHMHMHQSLPLPHMFAARNVPHVGKHEIEAVCASVAKQMYNNIEFIRFATVSQRVCGELGVTDFRSLGCSAADIPVLHWLFHIEQTVDAHILAFASSRGIATLYDLQLELVQTLNVKQFQPLLKLIGTCGEIPVNVAVWNKQNPDEIDLDVGDDDGCDSDNDDATETKSRGIVTSNDKEMPPEMPTTFLDFGLGKLNDHPLVHQIWNVPSTVSVDHDCISFMDVAKFIPDFLTETSRNKKSLDFGQFLCQKFEITHLAPVGILIVERALPQTLQAFRVVEHNAFQLHVKATKIALNELRQQDTDLEVNVAASRPRKRMRQRSHVNNGNGENEQMATAVALKPCTHEQVEAVVNFCRERLAQTWSPTSNKVHNCILQTFKDTSCQVVTKTSLLKIATEYVMLHIGSRKWRQRQFICQNVDHVGETSNDTIDTTDPTMPTDDLDSEAEIEHVPREKNTELVAKKEVARKEKTNTTKFNRGINTNGLVPIPTVHSNTPGSKSNETQVTICSTSEASQINNNNMYDCSIPASQSILARTSSEKLQEMGVLPYSLNIPKVDATDPRAVGRWGESLVYQYLLATLPNCIVDWVNEHEETKAAYDIIVTDKDKSWSSTRYIEVKSTRFMDRNVFELSYPEWEFASKDPPVKYDVYRVFGAGCKDGPIICPIHNIVEQVSSRNIRLCLAI